MEYVRLDCCSVSQLRAQIRGNLDTKTASCCMDFGALWLSQQSLARSESRTNPALLLKSVFVFIRKSSSLTQYMESHPCNSTSRLKHLRQ
jgi:hypothetical protein